MSSARSEAGKWLVLILGGTLILDWCLRTLAGLATAVIPIVLLIAVPVAAGVLVVRFVQRRGGGGW